jgi:cardiolipin synthase
VHAESLCGNTIRTMSRLSDLIGRCVVPAAIMGASTGCAMGAAPVPATPNASAAAPFRLIQEPEDGYQFAPDLIAAATRSVRMTMYELADPAVVNALIDAHQRRLTVKVILDAAFHGRTTNQNAYTRLHAAGIAVTWAPPNIIYHQKTIVTDDTSAAVSTANLVSRYYPTSRDAVIVTNDQRDVTAIAATFDADFTTTASDPPIATSGSHLIWSPGAKSAFLHHISGAATTLDITTEELTDHDVTDAIAADARRGVACRIVMTTDHASSRSLAHVAAAGCSVHLLPHDPGQLYMHEKAVITDNRSLLVGSQNLSTTSLRENRELSMQLDSQTAPDVVDAVRATFDHDYQQAAPAPNSNR